LMGHGLAEAADAAVDNLLAACGLSTLMSPGSSQISVDSAVTGAPGKAGEAALPAKSSGTSPPGKVRSGEGEGGLGKRQDIDSLIHELDLSASSL